MIAISWAPDGSAGRPLQGSIEARPRSRSGEALGMSAIETGSTLTQAIQSTGGRMTEYGAAAAPIPHCPR